ncbi:MAG: isocitrate lyase/phosphoenolpyruvate mutase family protein [Pseudomonadota bacterium]
MSDNAKLFFSLHTAGQPLILPNAWDAASAALFQDTGAAAIATSSASLAWSLGYADGGGLPRQELLGAVGRILRLARVPVTVDIEDGYSDDPADVAALAAQLAEAGVAGINLEDGSKPPALLAAKIAAIRAKLGAGTLFVNARTDVYLRGQAPAGQEVAMTVERAQQYRAAGADGIFVPGLRAPAQVAEIAKQVPLPLNLMMLPGLAPVQELAASGMRRLSAGSATFQAAYGVVRARVQVLLSQGAVDGLFEGSVSYPDMQRICAAKA